MNKKLNLTMLTDFYEITMAHGYFQSDMADDIAYFAEKEGLSAHARSATVRTKDE